MRNKIWAYLRAKFGIQPGQILPKPLLVVRAILYPLDSFYWWMSESRGYQLFEDVWLINGVRYDASMLKHLSEADGECYRIVANNGVVWMERITQDVSIHLPPNPRPGQTVTVVMK